MLENTRPGLLKAIFSRRMLICLFNGLAAGMPLFFLYHLIPAWLRSENVDLKTIGLFSLVGIPYTWKFLWSPLMDRFSPPFLGRRRGWMLLTQLVLLGTMMSIGLLHPVDQILSIAAMAVVVAFFSASQDIVLDAYRRELLPDKELGLGNSMYVNGYRAAVFIPGGLGLILADHLSWPLVFMVIGAFMLIAIAKTLLIKEAYTRVAQPANPGRGRGQTFQGIFRPGRRCPAGAPGSGLSVLLQVGRQHGDRPVNSVLSRFGIF